MNKTFRGLLADGAQIKINLSTNQGMIGYRINKLQILPKRPFAESAEHVVKVFSVEQDSVDAEINFDSPTLLAATVINNHSSGYDTPLVPTIIIDDVKVNQDIYITHSETQATEDCNYYLELERVKLDLNEATVATLKDMRGRE